MKSLILLATMAISAFAAEPNTLTPAEKKEGFKLLFNGKDLEGWRNYKKDKPSEKWQVQDGAITLVPGGGDLVSTEQFGDFELRFEFKIAADGNSGVMWHVAETESAPYVTGPEYQVLDSHATTGYANERKKGNISGALYDLIPAKPEWSKPASEWNEGSIKVVGTHITLTINGQVSADVDLASDKGKELLAKSKFATWPKFAKEPKGHFCFQDHGNVVAFRTIRVKAL